MYTIPIKDVSPSGAYTARQLLNDESPTELDLLRLTLNQVDYGLVVVEVGRGIVQFANAPGGDALASEQPGHHHKAPHSGLCLQNGRVVARDVADTAVLERSLQRTRAGLRGLLSLGPRAKGSPVAVVPLSKPQLSLDAVNRMNGGVAHLPPCYALLIFAKPQLCDDSTMALFARERGLTSAEGQVLTQVCKGMRPSEIATRHGVQISTVRTQLRSIRMKTSCDTIRELVEKVSVLPPMAMHLSRPHNGHNGGLLA